MAPRSVPVEDLADGQLMEVTHRSEGIHRAALPPPPEPHVKVTSLLQNMAEFWVPPRIDAPFPVGYESLLSHV